MTTQTVDNPMLALRMSEGQQRALNETRQSIERRRWHLVTGYAGSGKTTMIIRLVLELRLSDPRLTIALAAPTHKAAQVMSQKLKAAGVDEVPVVTLHRLLGLKAVYEGDEVTFVRSRFEQRIEAEVVLIDEVSMVGRELNGHIETLLDGKAVVFIGDPAQLPPINERESVVFSCQSKSHLDTIIRQAADNPIIAVADLLRRQQGCPLDMTWVTGGQNAEGRGVFMPRDAMAWAKRAYTSPLFQSDPFAFRYLAWTNDCVARVNHQVREWLFGQNIPFPIMPTERALFRSPLMIDETIVANTNEEAQVLEVEAAEKEIRIPDDNDIFQGTSRISLPVWRMSMRSDEGMTFTADMPVNEDQARAVLAQIKRAAQSERRHWKHYHAVRQSFARVQAIYAQTVHTSQGSTYKHVFVNIPDILRRKDSNLLETQQLLYVAITRASDSVMLVGGR